MLNTTQAAALHAFNNNGSQGRLTETSLARALKSEKVLARTTIAALREKGMISASGKYEFRITDAGKKYLKNINSTVSATLNKAFTSAPAEKPVVDQGQPGGALDAAWSASCEAADAKTEAAHANTLEQVEQLQQADTVDIDAEIDALVEQGLVQPEGDTLQVNEPASTKALLDAELTLLAESLAPEQFPVIDDIDSKQHALTGIAVLLKQRTPALASLAEQLATDLSVIRLHQERRA
ncbi:hypothetical protein [Rheinheimera fenheensis]|uniref:hypothetical protein n=1 Tax=Rheinheimera fenheensis TaxID=3152295 RepID=UPI003260414F